MNDAEFLARYFPWMAERVFEGIPTETLDPDPARCPSVWRHVHGWSQCELSAQHKAEEHHGRCASCGHDDEDNALSWREEA